MCGIAGIVNLRGGPLPDFDPARVLESLRHRGPDDTGVFLDEGVFLAATRLSVIDPAGGHQPVRDEQSRFHLVMNGEIYGHDRLLADLVARGHQPASRCDTEAAVHLFEDQWTGALDVIDGQFAIAAWDSRDKRLLLARDRMGISPLFYARVGDVLIFGSEAKAIFATGLVHPRIDPRGLDTVLAVGSVPAPRSLFEGLEVLRPGYWLEARNGALHHGQYWDIPYPDAGDYPRRSEDQWAQEFREHLTDACRRRLVADVPVGLYLSGGIDSATIAALTADHPDVHQRVFTIAFPEPGFDESTEARQVGRDLGIVAHQRLYHQRDLAADLPKLVYHAEMPQVSSESVPLMALSSLAKQYVKVVLTGEGADEALGGYEYFKWEAFKRPFGRLAPIADIVAWPYYAACLGARNPFTPLPADRRWAREMFGCYPSAMVIFHYFRSIRDLVYTPEMLARAAAREDAELLDLPKETMRRWNPLNRSLYVANRVFMAGHLLAAHGDRALMAHSIEGRYPFLDRRVQEFCAIVPPGLKTRWSSQKVLLRRAMADRLPQDVLARVKKPFLAPFGTPFIGDDATDYIRHLLEPRTLRQHGWFDPAKVDALVQELLTFKAGLTTDRKEGLRMARHVARRTQLGMALTFVVSTQVLADQIASGRFAMRESTVSAPEASRAVSPA